MKTLPSHLLQNFLTLILLICSNRLWKSTEHLEELRKVNSFFSPQKKEGESHFASQISGLETPKSLSTTTSRAGQQTVDSCINIFDAVKSEIFWTLKIVDCGFSLQSTDNGKYILIN